MKKSCSMGTWNNNATRVFRISGSVFTLMHKIRRMTRPHSAAPEKPRGRDRFKRSKGSLAADVTQEAAGSLLIARPFLPLRDAGYSHLPQPCHVPGLGGQMRWCETSSASPLREGTLTAIMSTLPEKSAVVSSPGSAGAAQGKRLQNHLGHVCAP